MYTVYRYREQATGKSYIGYTRGSQLDRIGLSYMSQDKFANVIRHYMIEYNMTEAEVLQSKFFTYEVLETLKNLNAAVLIEEYFIQYYDSIFDGYNMIPSGSINAYKKVQNLSKKELRRVAEIRYNGYTRISENDEAMKCKYKSKYTYITNGLTVNVFDRKNKLITGNTSLKHLKTKYKILGNRQLKYNDFIDAIKKQKKMGKDNISLTINLGHIEILCSDTEYAILNSFKD